MKLSCLQEDLKHGLTVVGKAVSTRATLPITNNVLLATENGRLKMTAFNVEMAISYWVGAKIEEEGSITLPALLTTEYVSSLTGGAIELTLIPKTKQMNFKSNRHQARVSGVDSKDFPPLPTVKDGRKTTVNAHALSQAINHTVIAASNETSRPILTGIDCKFSGKKLTMAGADGFRLAVYSLDLDSPIEATEVIIPARTLSELESLLAHQEEPVEISIGFGKSGIYILFKLKNCEVISMLLSGKFPDYEALIPKEIKSAITVKTEEMAKAVKSVSLFAAALTTIRMRLGTSQAALTSHEDEVGDTEAMVEGKLTGPEARIAFNGKYLREVLGEVKESEISLGLSGSESAPVVIRPVGVDNYTYVLMPVFVQW